MNVPQLWASTPSADLHLRFSGGAELWLPGTWTARRISDRWLPFRSKSCFSRGAAPEPRPRSEDFLCVWSIREIAAWDRRHGDLRKLFNWNVDIWNLNVRRRRSSEVKHGGGSIMLSVLLWKKGNMKKCDIRSPKSPGSDPRPAPGESPQNPHVSLGPLLSGDFCSA